jgi:hypothetical protein
MCDKHGNEFFPRGKADDECWKFERSFNVENEIESLRAELNRRGRALRQQDLEAEHESPEQEAARLAAERAAAADAQRLAEQREAERQDRVLAQLLADSEARQKRDAEARAARRGESRTGLRKLVGR